jgi:hypothetical protein
MGGGVGGWGWGGAEDEGRRGVRQQAAGAALRAPIPQEVESPVEWEGTILPWARRAGYATSPGPAASRLLVREARFEVLHWRLCGFGSGTLLPGGAHMEPGAEVVAALGRGTCTQAACSSRMGTTAAVPQAHLGVGCIQTSPQPLPGCDTDDEDAVAAATADSGSASPLLPCTGLPPPSATPPACSDGPPTPVAAPAVPSSAAEPAAAAAGPGPSSHGAGAAASAPGQGSAFGGSGGGHSPWVAKPWRAARKLPMALPLAALRCRETGKLLVAGSVVSGRRRLGGA